VRDREVRAGIHRSRSSLDLGFRPNPLPGCTPSTLNMRMVWIGLLFFIFASSISLVAAICDTVPANIKLGLFVNGDYESYRIRNSVQLALQAISSTRFGVSLGIDSITLSASNTFLDGCFRNTSSLDPQFPANNPSSIASALQTGFSTMISNGVHVRRMHLFNTFCHFCIFDSFFI
jgi:hypothetical protein